MGEQPDHQVLQVLHKPTTNRLLRTIPRSNTINTGKMDMGTMITIMATRKNMTGHIQT